MKNNIKIISAYHGMTDYIKAARASENPDKKQLWMQYAIEPFWDQWAAGQFNEERTREEMSYPAEDLDRLEEAVIRIGGSGIEELLQKAYDRILQLLPYPEEEKVVCVYANIYIDEAIHGVLGTCIGDSILVQVNPMIDGWQQYIPWVLAHEYNHTVWGYHYYYLKGNSSQDLLTSIITEGEADSFAKAVSPEASPSWIRAISNTEESRQWLVLKEFLYLEDSQELHVRYFFGDSQAGVPSNTGYTIGYHIVQMYLKAHPEVSFEELANKDAKEILNGSGYDGCWKD